MTHVESLRAHPSRDHVRCAATRTFLVLAFAASCGVALAGEPPPAAASSPAAWGRETLKSKLSDKASDEQRIDDCGVPKERRTRQRPTECPAQPTH